MYIKAAPDPPILVVTKTSDQSKTNDDTAAADSALTFDIKAGKLYWVEFLFELTATTNGDFKGGIGVTGAGNTGVWDSFAESARLASTQLSTFRLTETIGNTLAWTAGFTNEYILLFGRVIAAAAGTVFLNWAQNTSHADATTIHKNSFGRLWELGNKG